MSGDRSVCDDEGPPTDRSPRLDLRPSGQVAVAALGGGEKGVMHLCSSMADGDFCKALLLLLPHKAVSFVCHLTEKRTIRGLDQTPLGRAVVAAATRLPSYSEPQRAWIDSDIC